MASVRSIVATLVASELLHRLRLPQPRKEEPVERLPSEAKPWDPNGPPCTGDWESAEQTQMPQAAWRAFEAYAVRERRALELGTREGAEPQAPNRRGAVFEAVRVSLPLAPPVLDHDPRFGGGQDNKNLAGVGQLTLGGSCCMVYALGLADVTDFEVAMTEAGCETHGFDCTVSPDDPGIKGQRFFFHQWCIGTKADDFGSAQLWHQGVQNREPQFKSLKDTMDLLGHEYINILKFDIEGNEWELIEQELLTMDKARLPEQLAFELHTEKADPRYVPTTLTKGKGFVAVNRLVLELHDLGYRVISKELNGGDAACAEFVFINVNRRTSTQMLAT